MRIDCYLSITSSLRSSIHIYKKNDIGKSVTAAVANAVEIRWLFALVANHTKPTWAMENWMDDMENAEKNEKNHPSLLSQPSKVYPKWVQMPKMDGLLWKIPWKNGWWRGEIWPQQLTHRDPRESLRPIFSHVWCQDEMHVLRRSLHAPPMYLPGFL